MKRILSALLTLALLVSMMPLSMADSAQGYIAAPYTVDGESANPTEYLAPVFYANGEGEPTVGVTLVGVITDNDKYFKDSDNDKELDPFEDWRLDAATRAEDLVSKLSVEQKIGLIGIQLVCSPSATKYEDALDENGKVVFSQLINVVSIEDERVNNSTAEIIENRSRLGVVRVGTDAGAGSLWKNAINMTAEFGAVTKGEPNVPFLVVSNPQITIGEPGTIGIAAAAMGDVANGGDYSAVEQYADIYRQIWDAKGIDRMYGPQIDLITDPRWSRNVTAFTEVPDVNAELVKAMIKGYQGSLDGVQSNGVALIMKHFPGDGSAYNGMESHYTTGQWRMYLTENSLGNYQLAGFQAAVDANVAGIMTAYSRPSGLNAKQTYRGVEIPTEELATAYNTTVLQTLLRQAMNFKGFVNTDSMVFDKRFYGVEDLTELERAAELVNRGCDIVGDYWATPFKYSAFLEAYQAGLMKPEALDRAVYNNVKSMFEMGRFDNPYEDVEANIKALNNLSEQAVAVGAELSRKSIVLLKNHENILPLKEAGKKVFIASFTKNGEDEQVASDWKKAFIDAGYEVVENVEDAEIALLDVAPGLNESGNAINTLDLVDGLEVAEYDPITGELTGSTIDLTTVSDAKKIARYAKKVHENGGIVIGSININTSWILTNLEPYCDALISRFGSSHSLAFFEDEAGNAVTPVQAQMDVLLGNYNPTGKLPITMAACNEVVATVETEIDGQIYNICVSPNDVPGLEKDQYMSAEVLAQSPSGSYAYLDTDGNVYSAWFGLSY